MPNPVDTSSPEAVQQAIHGDYLEVFPEGDPEFPARAFTWVIDCFRGRYKNYLPIDARYHDLEHTLQVTLCMSRLLKGRYLGDVSPPVSRKYHELAVLAILLHDTGYLKTADDPSGTGAKYTLIHVSRSAEFAATLLREKGFDPDLIQAVKNMIRCTGVNADLEKIPFGSDVERELGFSLATADLLGQMAADDYIEKLPILFTEFDECARYNGDSMPATSRFESSDDLMSKTPLFWQHYVLPKINNDFEGIYHYLDHLPDHENFYLSNIEANIERLKERYGTAA